MTQTFLSIGECMIEMAPIGDHTYRQGFAGDTFNTAWHARRALPPDWQVEYFTALGDDPLSDRMLAFMHDQNIATPHVARLKNKSPGLYTIALSNGERSFTYWRNVSAARHLADDSARLTAAIAGANVIFFSGITLAILSVERRAVLLDVLKQAKARGAIVAFDSNIRMRLWPDAQTAQTAISAAAAVSTLALPSVEDEMSLFQAADAKAVVRRYLGAGVAEVVVKAGAAAATVVWPGGEAEVSPPENIIPVDTTGAGDSFNGTYIAARLCGSAPKDATRTAHTVAARVIQHHGALV